MAGATDTGGPPRAASPEIAALGVIAATKLQPPRPRAGLVPRDALVALLAGGSHTRLTLLSAPAGSGKTTLLTLWRLAAFETRPFAWLSLDASDNDPVRFWTSVIESLRTVVPGAGAAAAGALPFSGGSLDQVVLPLLINELAEWEQPIVLVLDDLHEITEPKVHASLAYVLEHMPETLHLALATREDPDLPLHRLRARDESVELRAGHLRFSRSEARSFLNDGLGLELAAEDVARLHERTDGWPAGLQLAGLSLRGRTMAEPSVEPITAGDSEIVDYLMREVLDGISDDLRVFMLHTSILDRMSGSLCDAVTRMEGSAVRLRELERRNLFTMAVDPQREWYRYHPVFADVLRRELVRAEPEQVGELHARAATWCAREGCAIPDAISHALAAQDIDGAAELIAANWQFFFNRGWLDTVAQWLRALPEDVVRADTRLWLARIWTALDVGALDEAEPWLEQASQDDATRRAWADVLRAIHGFKAGDIAGARAAAERVHPGAEEAPGFLRTAAALARGVTAFWQGDRAAAQPEFEAGRQLAAADGNVLAQQYALGYLALDATERRAWDDARRLVGEVDALVEREPAIAEHFTAMIAALARSRLAVHDGSADDAETQRRRAVELSTRGAGAPEIAAASERGPRPTRPRRVSDRDELSDGELRVLRLLPGELSLREIGAELFVSLNTVKTHTRNIYAKLGSGSRAEAVARARELGLL